MKPAALLPLAAFGLLAFGTLAPQAQTPTFKVGFVDVQTAAKAHPKYSEVDTVDKQAVAALTPTSNQIKAIQDKGANATAAERQQLDTLIKTFQADSKKWNDQINAKMNPINDDLDKAVAAVAKAQGFTIIMNRAVAGQGLVIYADLPSSDLTQAVITQLKK